MIPLEKRIFFFHIMKTGGTTLSSLLDKQFDTSQICPARHWYELEKIPLDELLKYKIFRGHFNFAQLSSFPEFPFAVTLIRNPIDRVISEYLHWQDAPEQFLNWHPEYGKILHLAKKLPILEFIRNEDETGFFVNNRQTYQLAISHSMPRVPVKMSPGDLLDGARENLAKFQLVGTIETIEKMVDVLCFHFGWMPSSIIPTTRARDKVSRIDMSSELRDELAERNSLDLKLYEYANELINVQYETMINDLGVGKLPNSGASHEVVQKTLFNRYETAYKLKHPQLLSEYSLSFEQAFDGDGWLARQYDRKQKITWRWSGPGTISILDLPLSDHRNLRISFDVIKVSDANLLKTMVIKVNDTSLQYEVKTNANTQTCIFDVPINVLKRSSGRARISIEVEKTVKVPDRYPHTYMNVGLAISAFHVIPLNL